MHFISDTTAVTELQEYLKEENLKISERSLLGNDLLLKLSNGEEFMVLPAYRQKFEEPKSDISDALIFGKDLTTRIVACELRGSDIIYFRELPDGSIEKLVKPAQYWILSPVKHSESFKRLEGDLHYKFIKSYTDYASYNQDRKRAFNNDLYVCYDPIESNLIRTGVTFFKDTKVDDVSVLSFDIETDGLNRTANSEVYLISNSFRKQGKVIRKLFDYKDYKSIGDMIVDWCKWVKELDPTILTGHNIYSYDLPYLDHCAKLNKVKLSLGRDGSDLGFSDRESKFRKEASQYLHFFKPYVFGRQVIDTLFLAIDYDRASRKYENYNLKQIIKQENLESKDRVFYDASKIRHMVNNTVEWQKIRDYCLYDADDALALYELMIPASFYLTQSVPRTLESVINSATGSKINSFLVRSYLQDNHSIPKGDEKEAYEGAVSMGNPGVYHNVFKVDVASLYPSIIRHYRVYDQDKDPKGHLLKMVEYFTLERLKNKKLAKDTKNPYYKSLSEAQKIVVNSAYGMLGAPGLSFNSPKKAEFITRMGREILLKCIAWCESKQFTLVNADTDSISFTANKPLTMEDRKALLSEINVLYPDLIRFEDDGYYDGVLVVKTKNYCLYTKSDDKYKIKGSALKATMKEKALKELINRFIKCLLNREEYKLSDIYNSYVKEIFNLTDISRWSSKKTLTDKIYEAKRTTERKVLEAIQDEEVSAGDKIFVYFDKDNNLKMQENFNNDHNTTTLLKKLYKTLEIFSTVINVETFLNYSLKRNKAELEKLLQS